MRLPDFTPRHAEGKSEHGEQLVSPSHAACGDNGRQQSVIRWSGDHRGKLPGVMMQDGNYEEDHISCPFEWDALQSEAARRPLSVSTTTLSGDTVHHQQHGTHPQLCYNYA